jgi:hypothetical protein
MSYRLKAVAASQPVPFLYCPLRTVVDVEQLKHQVRHSSSD